MGLSSFWHSLTRHKAKEMAPQTQHSKTHGNRQREIERNTHPALRQSNTPGDAPSRDVEPMTKQAKRRSVWRPSPSSTMKEPILGTDKKTKRRSFWRSEPSQPEFRMYTVTAPGVPAVPVEHRPTLENVEQKKNNRQSVMSMASIKSSKSTKSSKSRKHRSSIFGGRMDDEDSDDEIPAVPALPASMPTAALPKHLPYQRRRDMGNNMAMPGSDEKIDSPGTAITSADLSTTALPSIDKQKRQSKSFSAATGSRRKSTVSQKSSKSGKSRRPSWFSSSNPDAGEAVPPVPALGFDNMPSPFTDSTFDSDFERFLVKAHHNVPGSDTPRPTDFEQFMQESADYDKAKSNHFAYRGNDIQGPLPESTIASANRRGSYAGPRNAAKSFRMSTTQASPAARHGWRHSQHGGNRNTMPARVDDAGIVCVSEDQQKEWERLKELMDKADKKDDDGVMGMLRQLEEDEDEDSWAVERGRNRDSEAVYENRDALAALELGVAK